MVYTISLVSPDHGRTGSVAKNISVSKACLFISTMIHHGTGDYLANSIYHQILLAWILWTYAMAIMKKSILRPKHILTQHIHG